MVRIHLPPPVKCVTGSDFGCVAGRHSGSGGFEPPIQVTVRQAGESLLERDAKAARLKVGRQILFDPMAQPAVGAVPKQVSPVRE